jgi:Tfp pilus tip-associated adhesin PilY1
MIHGIDARLGVEVWAFIPFNLLPKLRSLRDGQPVGAFEYFADGSAKIADVKVNGTWRTYMVIGQGAGGTFYQTFDVSDAGLGVDSVSDNLSAVLAAFSAPEVIPLRWTFPRYEAFDQTVSTAVTPFGDLGAAATAVEMTVGQTWSQPAIGRLNPEGGYVMVVGSGFLSADQEKQVVRGEVRAGTTFYVIDMANGAVLDHQDVSDDPSRSLLKNALHSDPSLAGPIGTRLVSHAYIGDTEGVFWRFNLVPGQNGAVKLDPAVKIYDFSEGNPIFSPPALVDVAAATRYIFLSTGTSLLPRAKKLQNFKLIGLLDTDDGQGVKRFEVALDRSDGRPGDERPVSAPAVAGDAVFFATTTVFPDNPCAIPESDLRALTYVGGPIYDTTGDDRVDRKDSVIIARMTGRATTLTSVDRHVMLVAGSALESFGDPADFSNGVREGGVRLLSWRELR